MDSINWDLVVVAALGVIGLLFTVFGRKKTVAPTPVVPGPSPVQQDQDKKESEAEKKAEQTHDVLIVDITDQHDKAVAQNIEELEKKTEAVEGDPKATNETLIEIGKQVRGGGS
jgi:hypothetical protein